MQFSFGTGKCLSCGMPHRLQPAEYEDGVVPRVAEWIKNKRTEDEIKQDLIQTFGIPGTDTDEIFRLAKARVRKGYREYGGKIAASGLLVTLASVFLLALSSRVFVVFAATGIAMLIGGMLMRVTGWNLAGEEAN